MKRGGIPGPKTSLGPGGRCLGSAETGIRRQMLAAVYDVPDEELVIDERVRRAGCFLAILTPDTELPPTD